jgi:hypothetical protein
MPATVSQVSDGIKTALATVSGLRTYSFQPEQLNPPFAYPELTQVTYHRSMGLGDVEMQWTINVVVGRYTDRTANDLLDQYLSPTGAKSIRAALESDKTLGGVVQTLILSSAADVTALNEADANFLQIQFQMTVHA